MPKPKSDLITAPQAAELVGVTRQRILAATKQRVNPLKCVPGMPEGVTLFERSVVLEWKNRDKPKGGRPKKEQTG